VNHTWHPNTFGLITGQKTAKTACSRRKPHSQLVPNLQTDCPGCQAVILEHLLEMQAIALTVHELRRAGLVPPAPTVNHRTGVY
jgi:hypothetical protein